MLALASLPYTTDVCVGGMHPGEADECKVWPSSGSPEPERDALGRRDASGKCDSSKIDKLMEPSTGDSCSSGQDPQCIHTMAMLFGLWL